MIIFMRHQEGHDDYSNCLTEKGIKECKTVADTFKNIKNLHVYTCSPSHEKHIRPIQTASIVCTYLQTNLIIVESENALPSDCNTCNHLVIWHHKDIDLLVKMYYSFDGSLNWKDDDYYRCIILDSHRMIDIRDFRKMSII